jgi:hypothetical protein
MTEPQPRDVVILVHGIRDIARWESEIRATLERNGFSVEPTNYGRMNLIEFLLPIPYYRRRAISTIWTQIQHAQMLHSGADFSVIAHSFGTYVIAQLLKTQFNIKFRRVIFCGSVVRYNFPFEQFSARYSDQILNEVGTADPWPAVAESVTFGYGSAGTYGFRRPSIRDRFHNGAGHGYFLSSDFCQKFWVPYLQSNKIEGGDDRAKYPSLWVLLLTIFNVKYLLLLAGALFLARALLFQKPYYHSLNSSSSFYAWKEMVPTIVDEASQQCPLDFVFGDNCTHRPGATIVSFFTGRRYLQVQEFDGDTLRRVVSCRPYTFYGGDPVTALDELAHGFKECVSIEQEEGTNRVKILAETESMKGVATSDGTYYLCGCDESQVREFKNRHP